ncbi:MAG: transglycosylase SLT domain-containing protein [Bacteroidetes bacterium]|nr:transglycosylase SLT domain-containing protein [Bacteroidota bacterium]
MKRLSIALIFFTVIVGLWNSAPCFSQETLSSQAMDDDPIAAVLDSLYKLNLFEKGYGKVHYPKNPKYHFAIDSVPRYDEIIYESRLAKLDDSSPFDLQYNSIVKGYIEMYTFRKRELVSRMMALSQFYFPMFEEALDKYNLPLELKFLAICESALNPLAKSHSGAMGLWQFMYPTGKMYGLKVSSYIDERCDPYKSTIAACEYFQYLYQLFGDWQMVLAAYNGGPGTVNKAIRRSGGKRTYWEIRPYLPRETQGYVPAFIAVNYVMNYTDEHNLYSATPKKTFLQVDTITVKRQLSFDQISAVLDISIDEIQYLNPSYRRKIIPVSPEDPNTLTLPENKMGAFVTNEDKIYNYLKNDSLTSKNVLAMQETRKTYTVKAGEQLSTIARKYHCSVVDIKTWNGISSNTVKAGRKLIIYVYQKVPPVAKKTVEVPKNDAISVVENNEPKNIAEEFKYYTVKKGDSLYKIAQKNNTTIEEIKRLNNFGANYNLLPGKKIKIGRN